MSTLADDVLSRIRTKTDLFYRAANAHGVQMHEAVDLLKEAHAAGHDPVEVHRVTQRAVASSMKIIARADDSSGIIGDACRRLLDLHPRTASAGQVQPAKLVDWMMKFQFDGDVDFFELDPVRYAAALGSRGVEKYRTQLTDIADDLGLNLLTPPDFGSSYRREQFVLHWNAQRLAVLDQDVDMIIRTHARDERVAAWLQDTAEALEEVGEMDRALDWAQRAAEFDRGHQSVRAAEYWGKLISQHRPEDLLDVRWWVFDRWPNNTTAARLYEAAGRDWSVYRDAVQDRLADLPRELVLFQLNTLNDPTAAWMTAHRLEMSDRGVWERLVKAYQAIDPLAVLPILRELVEIELEGTGAVYYKRAARHLNTMRRLATGTDQLADVDAFIATLREAHRRRPRLQTEFTRAGLP